MNESIVASVRSSEKPAFVHGPVPAIITVTNTSGTPVSIQLKYPIPEMLRFATSNFEVATAKSEAEPAMARTMPIALPAGSSHTATYFLNRYFTFHGPGQAVIDWQLNVPFTRGDEPTVVPKFQGSFVVQLASADEHELRIELARYAEALQCPDRQTRLETAEALAFLDTPLAAEYLLPMLGIEGLEIIGIHALAANPSRKYDHRIVEMLSNRESGIVGAALEEIDRIHIPVSRSKIQRLLSSENPGIQWIALDWLARNPNREDLTLLAPLASSSSPAVRDRARAYEQLLIPCPY